MQSTEPHHCHVHVCVGRRVPTNRGYTQLEISVECSSIIKLTHIVPGEPHRRKHYKIKEFCEKRMEWDKIICNYSAVNIFRLCFTVCQRLQCKYFGSDVCLLVLKETPLPSVTWSQTPDVSPVTNLRTDLM